MMGSQGNLHDDFQEYRVHEQIIITLVLLYVCVTVFQKNEHMLCLSNCYVD